MNSIAASLSACINGRSTPLSTGRYERIRPMDKQTELEVVQRLSAIETELRLKWEAHDKASQERWNEIKVLVAGGMCKDCGSSRKIKAMIVVGCVVVVIYGIWIRSLQDMCKVPTDAVVRAVASEVIDIVSRQLN